MRLEALFRPGSIAVLGASEKPTIGRRLIASLDRIAYPGPVFPINPGYSSVLGRQCWPDLAALPQAPELALICLGHARVEDALRAAAERGVRGAVVYDGGFAEQGEEGHARQARIEAVCREAQIALCGPNCMGVLSPYHPSTSYLQELRDPAGLAGNVGIVSQSGSFCVSLLTDIRRFGFSHIVSSGNEAVLSADHFLEYLADDPNTRIIATFIETVRKPERFAAALDRAAANRKPVVVLKVGRTARTRRAISTHTGGEAGDLAAVSRLLREHGAIEVCDLVELTEVLAAFQGERDPAGRRLGIITASGGIAELILDLAAAAELEVPPLAAEAKARIEREIGFVSGDGNPLDAWGSGTFAENLAKVLEFFAASPDHDVVVLCRDNVAGQPFDTSELAHRYLDLFADAAARSRKPHYLLNSRPGIMDPALTARLRQSGVAVVGGLREGLAAIDRLAAAAISRNP
jgi:acyl-CoA synthetase (NDP forming)